MAAGAEECIEKHFQSQQSACGVQFTPPKAWWSTILFSFPFCYAINIFIECSLISLQLSGEMVTNLSVCDMWISCEFR